MNTRRHITTAGYVARATIDVTAIVAMGIAAAIAEQFDKIRKGVDQCPGSKWMTRSIAANPSCESRADTVPPQ